MTLAIARLRKPVIAAVNGAAVGIGVTMTLGMDIRLAAEGARFGFVFARRGIVPEAVSSFLLPRVVGLSRAVEWTATGRIFDAQEALVAGLVRSLHPADQLLPAALALVSEIAENTSPVAVAVARRMYWEGLGGIEPLERAHRLESRMLQLMGASEDARGGLRRSSRSGRPGFRCGFRLTCRPSGLRRAERFERRLTRSARLQNLPPMTASSAKRAWGIGIPSCALKSRTGPRARSHRGLRRTPAGASPPSPPSASSPPAPRTARRHRRRRD